MTGRAAAGHYTADDFDKTAIPPHLKKDAKDVIEMAVMLGWTLHVTARNACTIKAPPPSRKSYHFGAGGSARKSLTIVKRDVVKYADPDKLAIAGYVVDGKLPDTALTALPAVGDEGTVVDDTPKPESEPQGRIIPELKVDPPRPPSHEAQILSIRPLLAKANDRQGYESKTTVVRKWSDGTEDYGCIQCDFHSTNRKAPSAHFAKTHARGQGVAKRPPAFKAEVPGVHPYKPRQGRIDALAAALAEAWKVDASQGGEPDFEALARTSLTWVKEQSLAGTEFAEEREPETPEETLQRIRTLLDTGVATRQEQEIKALQEALVQTGFEMEALRIKSEEAEARAARARENLSALRGLVADLADDDTSQGEVKE